MKTKSLPSPRPTAITDADIHRYAEQLWAQSGRAAERDLDHWLEAKACRDANFPRPDGRRRLAAPLSHGPQKPA